MRARDEIHFESYCKKLNIEALTMLDMIHHQILPAVLSYTKSLCDTITAKQAAVPGASCSVETKIVRRISELTDTLAEGASELDARLRQIPDGPVASQAAYYHDAIFAQMETVRVAADELESLVSSEAWPYPTYVDLLFSE